MKKILSIVLLLAMCLSLFAGCTDKAAMAALESAKEYLEASYKDDTKITGADYQRGSVLKMKIDGVDHEFQVAWSTNSDKVKVVAGGGKMVTITVPYDNLEDVPYTLTATITDAKGNSVQTSFERVVPTRPGVYTEVENGTYVIVVDGKSYTSLTEDKSYGYNGYHEVTVENGTVSGHYKADVLTITNAEGAKGFTIQDAHGRYVYMTGSYNSCNVSAEMPEEGHIWQLLSLDGKYFIINVLKMKILAYDTQYSSWGAYPEITETRLSEVQMIKATAPATDPEPETPDVPDVPDVPSNEPTFVTNPTVGTAYKYGFYQANLSKYLYFTGAMNGNFYAMSENAAEAVDVYLETAEGGYYFYFMDGETKTYLSLEGYEKDGKQKAAVKLTTEATTVFSYSTEAKTYVHAIGNEVFYLGTYNDFNTISASSTYYITGDKASSLGVSQFAADFCTVEVSETPEQPETPAAPEFVTEPAVGTAYKYGFYQANLSKYLYFAGAMNGNFFAMTENAAEAVDVYLETAEGGYYFYFMDGETKTYLSLEGYEKEGKQKAAVKLTTEATTVFSYSIEAKTYVHAIGNEVFYLGTYNNFNTISASSTYYITGDKASSLGVSQFAAAFCTVSTSATPEQPEKPGTSDEVKLTNGMKVVIYAPGFGKALSSTMTGYNQQGVDVTMTDGVLTGYTDAEVWTVIVNADGTISFEMNGQKLAMGAEFASMKLGEVNDAWEVISLGNGLYNIKNVVRGNFIDWYAQKSNWSTYNQGNPAEDPAFQLSFYIVEE